MAILSSARVLFAILKAASIIFTVLIDQAQSQSAFISIDCGISDDSSYTDEATGISYFSDTNFTTAGESRDVSPEYKLQTKVEQFWNVRSFPEGIRNCYTLRPAQGNDTRYLIRARFMYGNYDNKAHIPEFNLYLGVDLWDTVVIEFANTIVDKEIILVSSSSKIDVCLVNTGYGVPFISALELRPLGSKVYASQTGTALILFQRYDFGTTSNELSATRYRDDIYDRLWSTFPKDKTWETLNNSLRNKNAIGRSEYEVPMAVLNTAYHPITSTNSGGGNLWFNLKPPNSTGRYYFYMHFAELEDISGNQSRNFEIFINGDMWSPGPILLDQNFYLRMVSVFTRISEPDITPDGDGRLQIWINRTENSTLPPLINAMEIFMVKELSPQGATDEKDANAMLNIKTVYEVKRNWQGDPCAPKAYLWDGLNCSYGANNPLRIVSLDLSASGLNGEISQEIADLKMLQYLDLSNNSLHGKVPEFLSQLLSLRVLNLQGNNFTGPIPDTLLKRSRNGLSMSFDTNLYDCSKDSELCGKNNNKKKHVVIPVAVSVIGFAILSASAAVVLFWCRRRRSKVNMKGSIYSKKQQFKYSEIKRITNNFERILGEGGFGRVYHGRLNGTEVAVKTLSSSSIQGHRQFHAELKLLLTVHHKNLTTLVGYCDDGTNIALIYEYMSMGNLRMHLSGRTNIVLSWEDRLRIAIDTAQGLEYLHSGCKPPIVHRDVKSSNILLTERLQAKLGDFGLSRIFPNEAQNDDRNLSNDEDDVLGISTIVAGTPGYLDPEYYASNWLNEKSDVYSFGVVLLEIISGQPALTRTRENAHIVQWVGSMVAKGDIKNIIDPKIQQHCDVNMAWKAIELATSCVAPSSRDRPNMNHVVMELKDFLSTEYLSTRKDVSLEVESKDFSSTEMISRDMISETSPKGR